MNQSGYKPFMRRNPWYELWRCAKRRCEDTKHKSYKFCGAIGIKFLLTQHHVRLLYVMDGGFWMKCPSLDRKDSNKDYTFDNCRVIEKSINERLPHDAQLAAQWRD